MNQLGRLIAVLSFFASFIGIVLGIQSLTMPPPKAPVESTTDPADGALEHLRKVKPQPLSGRLADVLNRSQNALIKTQPHPLLGKPAPAIRLLNVQAEPVSLDELLKKGPVVVVFYLGYACDHCVSQLFGLNEDLAYFNELGAAVLAISEDLPSKTREKYKKYGSFAFPVLSDSTHEVAQRYGVYAPAGNGRRAWEAHGTFVIGKDRLIHWAETGPEPFTHNPTLLAELARLSGRFPSQPK